LVEYQIFREAEYDESDGMADITDEIEFRSVRIPSRGISFTIQDSSDWSHGWLRVCEADHACVLDRNTSQHTRVIDLAPEGNFDLAGWLDETA